MTQFQTLLVLTKLQFSDWGTIDTKSALLCKLLWVIPLAQKVSLFFKLCALSFPVCNQFPPDVKHLTSNVLPCVAANMDRTCERFCIFCKNFSIQCIGKLLFLNFDKIVIKKWLQKTPHKKRCFNEGQWGRSRPHP